MSRLSERAEAVRADLKGEWFKHYLRNKSKRWRSTSLVKSLKRERLCDTEFEAWQVLAELAAAGVVEAPVASLKHRVSLTLGLSEAVCHRLLHALTGKAGQRRVDQWSRGLDQETLDDAALIERGREALDESLAAPWLAMVSSSNEEGR